MLKLSEMKIRPLYPFRIRQRLVVLACGGQRGHAELRALGAPSSLPLVSRRF